MGSTPQLGVGGNGGLLITESRAMMNYNALQAVLRQRLNHGLEFTANYTYGQSHDQQPGQLCLERQRLQRRIPELLQQPRRLRPGRLRRAAQPLRQPAVYALPVGRGKEYLSGVNRAMDEAIGGWKISTGVVAYSGFPETITGPGTNNSNSYGSSRVNQYRKLKIVGRSNENWFGTDPSATPCTTAGRRQRCLRLRCARHQHLRHREQRRGARSRLLQRGYVGVQGLPHSRSTSVGFRFDAFNAFNIVSYGNPDTGITDSNFGNVSLQGPRSTERHLQFSAKYTF